MQFSTAAVHAAEEQREAASQEAHRQALFPSLSSASTPTKPAPQNLAAGEALRHHSHMAWGVMRMCVHQVPVFVML